MTGDRDDVVLPDEAARARARESLAETLVVDAGAGAGKTKMLVDRFTNLVLRGVDVRSIAAVTFTEAAADQLRDRVRARLTREAAGNELAAAALADLDAAAIGTLHAFARRILAEHPIEAGLPPVIDVLVDVASSIRINRWWSSLRTDLLNDESMGSPLEILGILGVRVNTPIKGRGHSLEAIARALQADWDLVEDRLQGQPRPVIPDLDAADLRARIEALRDLADSCRTPDDKLAIGIRALIAWAHELLASTDTASMFALAAAKPKCRRNAGRSGNWDDVAGARDAVADFIDFDPLAPIADGAVRQVVWYLAQGVLRAARERQRDGQLLFHDLLVLARRMLRTNAEARAELSRKYTRLLLDEFQDTDPIQVELAVRIAAGALGDARDWRDCAVPAGSIFIVGDPKQSIYRFRRADIATYLRTIDYLGGPASTATLSTNFRSHKDVLAWVNSVFSELIVHQPDVQPGYGPLNPSPLREHEVAGPRVVTLQTDAEADAQEVESTLVADVIATAVDSGWLVKGRPITPGDVTVLVPSRRALGSLEAALIAAGIPYSLLAQSLLYGADEIRDLLLVASAADDPGNELQLVEALRTPILRCGDDDLWRWKAAGGSWKVWHERPADVPDTDPVAGAMSYLAALHRGRHSRSPSELLTAIVHDRGLLAVAAAAVNGRDIARRYRIAIDQARAWSESSYGSLRDYIAWARAQANDEHKTGDVALPDRDSSTVKVMTMHAAKGLEFPMVVLAGMATGISAQTDPVIWTDTGAEVSASPARTLGYRAAAEAEKARLQAERLRLLYVACTRAEEYLVVGTVGKSSSYAALLADTARTAGGAVWEATGAVLAPDTGPAPAPPPDFAVWQVQQDSIRAASARAEAVSAGAIAHRRAAEPAGLLPAGLAKDPQDLELPPWRKGRYGTAVGRAVHAALQTIDLVSGAGLDGTAQAQAMGEGIADWGEVVERLARSALASPTVRWAAARPHHKETFVGSEVDGRVVEGFIDLLVEAEDGSLVIVDYKTDAEPSPTTLQEYQRQLAVYGSLVRGATGRSVSRRVLVFCREEGGAVEVEV